MDNSNTNKKAVQIDLSSCRACLIVGWQSWSRQGEADRIGRPKKKEKEERRKKKKKKKKKERKKKKKKQRRKGKDEEPWRAGSVKLFTFSFILSLPFFHSSSSFFFFFFFFFFSASHSPTHSLSS